MSRDTSSDGERPGGVEQHRALDAPRARLELVRRARDRERRAEDVGVEPQLLDGADAEAVGGHQPEAPAAARALLRRNLRDGGRLADARRADEHFDRRVVLVVGGQRRELRRRACARMARSARAAAAARPGCASATSRASAGVEAGSPRARGQRSRRSRGSTGARRRSSRRRLSVFRHVRPLGRRGDLDHAAAEPAPAPRARRPRRVDSTRASGPRSSRTARRASLNGFPRYRFKCMSVQRRYAGRRERVRGTSACDSTPRCGSTRANSRHRCGRSAGEQRSTGCAMACSSARAIRLAMLCACCGSSASTAPCSVRTSDASSCSSSDGRDADDRQLALVVLIRPADGPADGRAHGLGHRVGILGD